MNVKEFWSKHKTKIIVGTAVVGGAVLVIVAKRNADKLAAMTKVFDDLATKNMITWSPTGGGIMNLEKVKAVLDANAHNASQFAIFREGPSPDDYICIVTNAKEFIAI